MGGAHVLFYSSPTTQQTSINISGRNENAVGEPRREGLPADLPHRNWKKDLPDGGKSTGGGGLACAGNSQERSVAGTEGSADQTERSPCKEPELGSSVRCCAPMAWGGFVSGVLLLTVAWPVRVYTSGGRGWAFLFSHAL